MAEYGNPWDYNTSDAYSSLENLTNGLADNLTAVDPLNNTNITNMTNVSLTNNSQTVHAIVYPADKLWVQTIFGGWFYVIVIYAITLLIFAKHDGDIGTTSWALLLMSAITLAANQLGNISLPVDIIQILYVSVALGVAGALYTIVAGQ